jgi:hypothetical protein
MMDNDDLIKRCESELSIIERVETIPTDDLDPDSEIGETLINLINDFNNDNKSRVNQLRLILSILKKADGDNSV